MRVAQTPAGGPGAASEQSAQVGTTEDNVAETYNAYCMKCKEKRDFEGRVETTDSGRRMAKGACPVCGTTVNKFLPKA